MVDVCLTCAIGYSERKFYKTKTGFGKKPLVAISLVVLIVIVMCLSSTEAAPRPPGHKKRHNRKHEMDSYKHQMLSSEVFSKQGISRLNKQQQQVNNISREYKKQQQVNNISREHRKQQQQVNNISREYKKRTIKITQILKNAWNIFNAGQKSLIFTNKDKSGKLEWLPKVNFVSIHARNSAAGPKGKLPTLKRKFHYTTPKLYQDLKHHEIILTRLRSLKVIYSGKNDEIDIKRNEKFLDITLMNLTTAIATVKEHMQFFNMTISFNDTRVNVTKIGTLVDYSTWVKLNALEYRTYVNTLRRWYMEIWCWFPSKRKRIECINYNITMRAKIDELNEKPKA